MDKGIKNIHHRFTKLYIVALSAVALLSILGQVLVQVALNEQSSDATVVNLAGRQRMLSQRICKNALLLTYNIKIENKQKQYTELTKSMIAWQRVHLGLQSNYLDSVGVKTANSEANITLFKIIEPHFWAIYKSALWISDTANAQNINEAHAKLDTILAHEREFLEGMNNIVFQYDIEAREHVATLKNIELLLVCLTMLILIIEGLLIFRPAVKRLQLTMQQLIASQTNAKAINDKLNMVNTNLKKTELELMKATNEKHEQQMSEQKIRAASLLKGQESERKRIAREMHDGIGQMLTALKLNIESISAYQMDDKNKMLLEDVRQLVGKTIAETRNITFDLMPTVLSDFGIASALKQLADQATRTSGAAVTFASGNTFERLDKHVEIGLYRIAQEAINNAVKYAQAKEITISLSLKSNYLYLNISDDGKGFDLKKIFANLEEKKFSRGIYNMQERTNLLDGEFKLTSAEGKGTKILSKIPVKYQ